ncbi:glycosyltransferase family 39 protein, partial [Candidatus Roizmanbacteria bacterium]|nr:glycosyltransferase family 39 protein [Candidatus Roizmanbacteria bacterium]
MVIPEKLFSAVVDIFWLFSIVFMLGSLYWPIKIKKFKPSASTIVIIIVLVFAFIIRFVDLSNLPWFVHGDEAEIGLGTRAIISGRYRGLVGVGWYNVPLISFAWPIIFFRFFGDNLFSLRLASVFLGIISIIFTYLIAKIYLKKPYAVAAACLLTLSVLHLHFSRSGTHYMQAVAVTAICFYAFLKGLETKSFRLLTLAGFFAGLSLSVYYAARFILILLPVFLVMESVKGTFRKHQRMIILSLLYGFLFSALPMVIFFISHSYEFFSRTREVFIFTNYPYFVDGYQTSSFAVIIYRQFIQTVHFFFGAADKSLQSGLSKGGFDRLTSMFFFFGLFLYAKNLSKDYRARFFFLWILCLLAASVLTIDAPFSPRLLSITPIVVITVSYALQSILKHHQHLLLSVFILLVTVANLKMYFVDYKNNQQYTEYAVLAFFIRDWAAAHPRSYFCVVSNRYVFDYGTIRFLVPQAKGTTYKEFNGDKN